MPDCWLANPGYFSLELQDVVVDPLKEQLAGNLRHVEQIILNLSRVD